MQWRFTMTHLCCPLARSCEWKMIAGKKTLALCDRRLRVIATQRRPWKVRLAPIKCLLEHFFSCATCAKDIFRGAPLKTNCVKCPKFQNKPPPPLLVMYGRAGRVTELWLSRGTFSWSCEGCGRDAHKADTGSAPVITTAGCVSQHSVTCDDDQPSSVTQLPAWQKATPLTQSMPPTGHSGNSQENIVGLRKRKDCVLWQRSGGVAANHEKLKIEIRSLQCVFGSEETLLTLAVCFCLLVQK